MEQVFNKDKNEITIKIPSSFLLLNEYDFFSLMVDTEICKHNIFLNMLEDTNFLTLDYCNQILFELGLINKYIDNKLSIIKLKLKNPKIFLQMTQVLMQSKKIPSIKIYLKDELHNYYTQIETDKIVYWLARFLNIYIKFNLIGVKEWKYYFIVAAELNVLNHLSRLTRDDYKPEYKYEHYMAFMVHRYPFLNVSDASKIVQMIQLQPTLDLFTD